MIGKSTVLAAFSTSLSSPVAIGPPAPLMTKPEACGEEETAAVASDCGTALSGTLQTRWGFGLDWYRSMCANTARETKQSIIQANKGFTALVLQPGSKAFQQKAEQEDDVIIYSFNSSVKL